MKNVFSTASQNEIIFALRSMIVFVDRFEINDSLASTGENVVRSECFEANEKWGWGLREKEIQVPLFVRDLFTNKFQIPRGLEFSIEAQDDLWRLF